MGGDPCQLHFPSFPTNWTLEDPGRLKVKGKRIVRRKGKAKDLSPLAALAASLLMHLPCALSSHWADSSPSSLPPLFLNSRNQPSLYPLGLCSLGEGSSFLLLPFSGLSHPSGLPIQLFQHPCEEFPGLNSFHCVTWHGFYCPSWIPGSRLMTRE